MKTIKELEAVIAPVLNNMGFQLYACLFSKQGGRGVLMVLVDAPNGITLGDCANISRQLGALLDVEDAIEGRYDLEVSSPGLERPLLNPTHYEQAIGKKAKIRLRQPVNERRSFIGVIKSVEENAIKLETEENLSLDFPFSLIERARLIFEMKK